MSGRKMLVNWPLDINKKIVDKQFEMEKSSGKKILKADAAISFVRDLIEKSGNGSKNTNVKK